MLLGAGSYPRAVHWARGVSCGGCDESVCCRTKRTIRTKGNCLEVNVEFLVVDDFLGAAVLVVEVAIGAMAPGIRPYARCHAREMRAYYRQ